MCGPHRRFAPLLSRTLRRIPWTVRTVATALKNMPFISANLKSFNTVNGRYYCQITFVLPSLRSGTWDVRTSSSLCSSAVTHLSAHTVNDKDCCNMLHASRHLAYSGNVSIPWTVGAVATVYLRRPVFMGLIIRFWQTSYRKRSVWAPIWSEMPMSIGKYWW